MPLPAIPRRSPTRAGSRWTGITRCSAGRCAATPADTGLTRAGTSTSCLGSASGACETSRGSPRRRRPSWPSHSMRSGTAPGRLSCSIASSCCGTRAAPTGPAGNTSTRVLGGPLRGDSGRYRLDQGWDIYVVPGLGVRCVRDEPWVTAAETAELAISLDAIGDSARALELLDRIQLLRDPSGAYWTGWQYVDSRARRAAARRLRQIPA